MTKKAKTQQAKEYHSEVAEIGCIIPNCDNPANIHHIREGQGMSQRASDYLVIPLCKDHHQGSLSIHATKRQFEDIFGSELDLLAETIRRLN
jgi:hypothetical protein